VKFARWLAWLLDEALDQVPRREDGRWFRYGQWGCQLRLWRFWWQPGDQPAQRCRLADGDGWIAAPTLERIGK